MTTLSIELPKPNEEAFARIVRLANFRRGACPGSHTVCPGGLCICATKPQTKPATKPNR